MESKDCDACFRAFKALCEEINNSNSTGKEEFNYWVFERGYNAALDAFVNRKKVNTEYLDATWSTQPSLEQDFALH